MSLVRAFALILRGLLRSRAELTLENLALRQQLVVLRPPGDPDKGFGEGQELPLDQRASLRSLTRSARYAETRRVACRSAHATYKLGPTLG